jgi:hypothetical protein
MQLTNSARRRRRFPQVELLEIRALLSSTPPLIQMESTTETNFQTVVIDYDVQASVQVSQFQVAIYRSAINQLNSQVDPLIIKTSLTGSNVTPGQHSNVPITISGGLEPDPSHPYVFAVATGPDNQSTDADFEKVVIGVVTHGFLLGSVPPDWVTAMAKSLKKDQFNDVIPFGWSYSWYGGKGIATGAGDTLAKEVESAVQNTKIVPAGAIVDIEMIGHSRGAVVVNQAFADLQAASAKIKQLQNGYWREVLLDPHPANTRTDNLFSFQKSLTGKAAYAVAERLQSDMRDPYPIKIPSMVSEVQDYYEHTSVNVLGTSTGFLDETENIITPWGVPGSDLELAKNAQTITHFQDLTDNGLVHTEVHQWYQEFVVPTLSTARPFVTGPIDAPLRAEDYLPVVSGKSVNDTTIVRFEDADPTSTPADFTITFDWGDGSRPSTGTAQPSALGGFDVVGSHMYSHAFTHYRVTVRINDVGGSKLTLTNTIYTV